MKMQCNVLRNVCVNTDCSQTIMLSHDCLVHLPFRIDLFALRDKTWIITHCNNVYFTAGYCGCFCWL